MDDDELVQTLESLNLKPTNVEKGRFGESYFTDKSTGEKYITPTKRPDGTFRKEIKIRPGYVPPEERQLYVPLHRRTQANQNSTSDNSLNFNKSNEKSTNKEEPSKAKPKNENNSSIGGPKQRTVTSGLKNNLKLPKQTKHNSNNKPPSNNTSKPKCDKTTSETNKNSRKNNNTESSDKRNIKNG